MHNTFVGHRPSDYIRYLAGKEFRCYLSSKMFSGQKKMPIPISFSNPSEKYLEIKQVQNM